MVLLQVQWFGTALGTNLKFYISVEKELKLKVRKFSGLIPTFVEVTRKKLVGGASLPSWIGLKVFLEILQNSQENTCTRFSFFNKVADLRHATLLKKRLWHRSFPVNFSKFLRTPFLQGTSRRLLLTLLFPDFLSVWWSSWRRGRSLYR